MAAIECDQCGEDFGSRAAYESHRGREGCRHPLDAGLVLWVIGGHSAWHLPPRADGQMHD